MLPFLAQGAAMAIEDAAVLARHLSRKSGRSRQARCGATRRTGARAPRGCSARRARNGKIYQYSGPDAAVRNFLMRRLGGRRLRNRYDWIYGWRDVAAATRDNRSAR